MTGSRILFSTLDAARTADLQGAVGARGVFERRLGGEEYIGRVQPLGVADDAGDEAVAIVLRSRTAHQQLQRLYGASPWWASAPCWWPDSATRLHGP